ncbi:hypothetical protein [Halobellus clavatus]|uniref:Uncharacterized protein n=1 Tax=Halobellus clavatus TaxID=660517 RepID=A0A1H3IWR2_9EURY|nr:hypothetical protein [Halobellus clavatus]SDY31775.1 hypothetical protein SAMN04487946_11123 [Halobellus clavatus]
MQIDTATLTQIQEYRVTADPIIASDHATGTANLKNGIHEERRTLVEDTSVGERVPVATWGELTALCSTASLTHAAFTNARFVRLYQYALREYLDRIASDDQNANAILPSNFPVLPADDETHEYARELREALKRDRDRWFTEHVDELDIETDGVPTAFWLHDSTTTAAELLAEWYAVGEVSDQLLQSLPSLPGQTPGENPETAESAATQTTDESDPAQAGLDMF